MRAIDRTYVRGMALLLAVVLFAFAYGSVAQAQTPADDQYGSPTEIGPSADAVGAQSAGSSGAAGVSEGAAGAAGSPASGVSAAEGTSGGVFASALPATGGSLLPLGALVGLALIGTGVLVLRARPARS